MYAQNALEHFSTHLKFEGLLVQSQTRVVWVWDIDLMSWTLACLS